MGFSRVSWEPGNPCDGPSRGAGDGSDISDNHATSALVSATLANRCHHVSCTLLQAQRELVTFKAQLFLGPLICAIFGGFQLGDLNRSAPRAPEHKAYCDARKWYVAFQHMSFVVVPTYSIHLQMQRGGISFPETACRRSSSTRPPLKPTSRM